MMRILLSLPVLVALFAAGAMYESYGQVDPCRALAVERARHTEHTIGLPVEGAVEPWTRAETSQMSTGDCARELLHAWRERL
jgi:hypothetical protein